MQQILVTWSGVIEAYEVNVMLGFVNHRKVGKDLTHDTTKLVPMP